jgi:type II secretory pathway pseudopilin PulG
VTSRSQKSASRPRAERGYILITLILFVALIAIAAVVMAPVIAFQVKRDREEELIHRGVQYSRAMKHFVKKFGRYPTRIEELENTNQVRFLRKRYKDPITGKDFKILHMGDVQMSFGAGIAGALPAGGLNQGGANPGGIGPGGPGAAGGLGGAPGINGAMNTMAMAGGLAGAGFNAANSGQGQGFGGQGIGGQGFGGQGIGNSGTGSQGIGGSIGGSTGGASATPAAGQDADENADSDATGAPPKQGGNPSSPGTATPNSPTTAPGAQTFGGGPMVGVASTSKDKTIRIFNKKDHYNQWQFIYDPSSDRGGLLTTPNQGSVQSSLQGATPAGQAGAPSTTPGAPGAPGGISGQPGPGAQPGQPTQPGMQTPQMPPDQEQ